MRFIYLIPKIGNATLVGDISKRLTELNMHDLGVDEVPRDAACNEVNVDGKAMFLLVPHQHGQPQPEFTYQPDKQTWLDPDDAGVQIGYWNDDTPKPDDLLRPQTELVDGYSFLDDGGRAWTTPVAKSPSRQPLPVNYQFNPLTNSPRGERKPAFDWLWTLSGDVWNYWNADKDKAGDPLWLADVARQLIGVNYYVGARELNALAHMGCALVDDVRAAAMTQALIDLDIVEEAENDTKKKSPHE